MFSVVATKCHNTLHNITLNQYASGRTITAIVTHCNHVLCKLHLNVSESNNTHITDDLLAVVGLHCGHLTEFSACDCPAVTDTGLVAVIANNPALVLITLTNCHVITDTTLTNIATHCGKLHTLSVSHCGLITDNGVCSVSTHCHALKTLNVKFCKLLTEVSLHSVIHRCKGLYEMDTEGIVLTPSFAAKIHEKYRNV